LTCKSCPFIEKLGGGIYACELKPSRLYLVYKEVLPSSLMCDVGKALLKKDVPLFKTETLY
jgi:hypothetical protein